MKKVLVIDGQGGSIGRALVEEIKKEKKEVVIYALGTNSTATENMMKGKADFGATGENPVIVQARDADYILGPIGIVLSDSMLGEITPNMANAVGSSKAMKILIPMNRCITVTGVDESLSLKDYIRMAVERIEE